MNVFKLKRAISDSGVTCEKIANELGITAAKLSRKIENQTLGIEDAEVLIRVLKLKRPAEIFFEDN